MLDPGVKDQSDLCEFCLIGTAMREEAKDALVAKDSPTGWQSDRWGSLGGGSRGTPPPWSRNSRCSSAHTQGKVDLSVTECFVPEGRGRRMPG